MKQKRKYKIIAIILFISIFLSGIIPNSQEIYGKINELYSTGDTSGSIDVDRAAAESTVLDAIGRFIYAIAGFIEKMVSIIIGKFSGDNIFPWADRVIFNTIPFLDVNFISPSKGSLFNSSANTVTQFGIIIGKMYRTVFVIAIAFFSVVVGIMAIRLAISTIASEKAKYKKSLMDWTFALILLFTAHYLMSFIFFVNEKMVEIASQLLLDQIENVDMTIDITGWSEEQCQHLVNLLYKNQKNEKNSSRIGGDLLSFGISLSNPANPVGGVVAAGVTKIATWAKDFVDNKGADKVKYNAASVSLDKTVLVVLSNKVATYNYNKTEEGDCTKDFNRFVCMLLTDPSYMEKMGFYDYATGNTIDNAIENIKDFTTGIVDDIFGSALSDDDKENMSQILTDACWLTSEKIAMEKQGESYSITKDNVEEKYKNRIIEKNSYIISGLPWVSQNDVLKYEYNSSKQKLLEIYKNNVLNTGISNQKKDLFTNMSAFFKNSVYWFKVENGEIKSSTATEFKPIPAILYAIFVIQSIMYFIAYLKRFFYIVTLALFAPLVIIYDFFGKTSIG